MDLALITARKLRFIAIPRLVDNLSLYGPCEKLGSINYTRDARDVVCHFTIAICIGREFRRGGLKTEVNREGGRERETREQV